MREDEALTALRVEGIGRKIGRGRTGRRLLDDAKMVLFYRANSKLLGTKMSVVSISR